jgi:hypothetical protein
MKYRVPVRFVIHGSVDVSAPADATNDDLLRLADEKSGDVATRMGAHARAGSAETFAGPGKDIRIVRMRR